MQQDSTIDIQIKQLLSIKLGLQKRSDGIFNQLLNGKDQDPLNNIFNHITRQNNQNKSLKKQLKDALDQLAQLKKQIKFNNTSQLKTILNCSEEYPPSLKSSKQSQVPEKQAIQQKKKHVTELRDKFTKKMDDFIIFLLKCIKQVSKSHITNQQDIQQLISHLQQSLQHQRARVSALQQNIQHNKKQYDILSKKQANQIKNPQQNITNLINEIKKTENKQQIFSKIFKQLGLQTTWQNYIFQIKQQSQMYHFLKSLYLDKNYLINKNINNINNQKILITQHQLSWSQKVSKICQNVKQNCIISSNKLKPNYLINSTKITFQQISKQFSNLLTHTMNYFFNKLDQMFIKHNLNPYQINIQSNWIDLDNLEQLLIDNNWEFIHQLVKKEIDKCFYHVNRRTIFYTADRMLIK